MTNIRRRLEALEKASTVQRDYGQAAVMKALESLGSEEVELLISALGAERAGRELDEPHSEARQRLRRNCERAHLPPASPFEQSRYLHYAIIITLSRRCSCEELELAKSAVCRTQRGVEPTAQESAAFEVYDSERERLGHLAGFASPEEFEALVSLVAGGSR
jgi:hypothetical protein